MDNLVMKVEINIMLNKDILMNLRKAKNSFYYKFRLDFLYHSNKIEGSTFTTESLQLLLDKNVVTGNHSLDDVYETVNSSYVFDYIIETLNEPITESFIKYLHAMLKQNTSDYMNGFSGCYKKIPNMILGVEKKLAQPFEVEALMYELLNEYNNLKVVDLNKVAEFHYRFESIHPFQDGNGRIGRFIMLKQMLENNIDIRIISEDNEDKYRIALRECQEGYAEPLVRYIESLDNYSKLNRDLYEL